MEVGRARGEGCECYGVYPGGCLYGDFLVLLEGHCQPQGDLHAHCGGTGPPPPAHGAPQPQGNRGKCDGALLPPPFTRTVVGASIAPGMKVDPQMKNEIIYFVILNGRETVCCLKTLKEYLALKENKR